MFGMMFLKQVRNDSVAQILAPAEKTAQGRGLGRCTNLCDGSFDMELTTQVDSSLSKPPVFGSWHRL